MRKILFILPFSYVSTSFHRVIFSAIAESSHQCRTILCVDNSTILPLFAYYQKLLVIYYSVLKVVESMLLLIKSYGMSLLLFPIAYFTNKLLVNQKLTVRCVRVKFPVSTNIVLTLFC